MATKQTYSIYRDNQLIAAQRTSLVAARKIIITDALLERATNRFPLYTIAGTSGFKRTAVYANGAMRWNAPLRVPRAMANSSP
jgi:hypothetical protein